MITSSAPPFGRRRAPRRRGVRYLAHTAGAATAALAALTAIVVLAVAACGTVTSPADAIGSWGGPHIALVVTAAGATAEFDCAHGSSGPLTPSSDGRFTAAGVWVREHGGPVRDGEVLPSFPARYSGRIQGTTMDLTVERTDSVITIGTFTLTKGNAPGVFKCL